jgi:hypothetical protein
MLYYVIYHMITHDRVADVRVVKELLTTPQMYSGKEHVFRP